jgi:hypothetical protein
MGAMCRRTVHFCCQPRRTPVSALNAGGGALLRAHYCVIPPTVRFFPHAIVVFFHRSCLRKSVDFLRTRFRVCCTCAVPRSAHR